MAYRGKFKPKNPSKYNGDVDKITYRSRWELLFMSDLDKHPDVLQWSSEETVVPYISPIDGKRHRYFPDFIVTKRNHSDGKVVTVMYEIKPKKQCSPPKVQKRITGRYINEVKNWGVNSAKWAAAEIYCRERGWTFSVITEVDLGIKY
jgi:hypothetical protein